MKDVLMADFNKKIILGVISTIVLFSCGKDPFTEYTGETKDQWVAAELIFESDKIYPSAFNDVDVDVVFKHVSGTELKMPAFWDGGSTWKVRFAPTTVGIWTYETICTDESNDKLHGQTGEFKCVRYKGDLDIYKKGFIKTTQGFRYFTYDNGSPFFYLSDAHMNIVSNDYNNFTTIIDKRVEQGFTGIASEPLGLKYDLSNGFTQTDLAGFQELDERFKYVAEKGFVHANSQLFFVSELGYKRQSYPDEYLEKLCRYWVARYAAYPVLWTTAQECDDDYKFPPYSDHDYWDITTNPWKLVASYVHQYDPYNHPLTAHMEYIAWTNATTSSFREVEGHDWWGVQWSPKKNGVMNFAAPQDFWNNGQGKVTVLYEGSFDYLWTNHFGCRVQGWSAFLTGMYGYGYGAADIWLYNSSYDMDSDTERDGIIITVEQKKTKWPVSLEFESAYQLGYMREFFLQNHWWELEPRFYDTNWFANAGSYFAVASKGNEIYVAYFYNPDNNTGTFKQLDNGEYIKQWFNPRTGETGTTEIATITDGTHNIGPKPDENDWVLLMKKS
ncbi:MAG: DUF5060 domain-containing protein [Bacteroidota bacterium]